MKINIVLLFRAPYNRTAVVINIRDKKKLPIALIDIFLLIDCIPLRIQPRGQE